MEDRLNEFKPSAPPPGLKERVLAVARKAPRPGLIDRLWTARTWAGLAAAFLGAVALFALSARPGRIEPSAPSGVARRASSPAEKANEGDWTVAAMQARLRGLDALRWENFR